MLRLKAKLAEQNDEAKIETLCSSIPMLCDMIISRIDEIGNIYYNNKGPWRSCNNMTHELKRIKMQLEEDFNQYKHDKENEKN